MSFLKQLPSQKMINRYASSLSEGDADRIIEALIKVRCSSRLIRRLEQILLGHFDIFVQNIARDGERTTV